MCQHKDGGFGGGYLQLPHLATTYAAVLTICELEFEDAYRLIDKFVLVTNFFFSIIVNFFTNKKIIRRKLK